MPKKVVQKKRFSLRKEYIKSWNYIKDSKKFIFIIIGLFFLFAFIGFFIPAPNYISQQILIYIQSLVSQTSSMSSFKLISFIFFNNIQSSLLGLILGVFFGIFPVFVALVNGYLLGFVANGSVKANGIIILWKLFPHGIFELPAVFISLGLGMKLGSLLLSKEKNVFKDNFINALRVFLLVVLPLLVIAAIIEGSLIVILNH
ncbi:MAG: stage II sporulation protein M [Candidatus Nanoarchaeia archaeon]